MSHNKFSIIACAGLMCGVSFSAFSEESAKGFELPGEFSGTVAFVSEYSFRGISQTDENPAIQGSIDWANDLGDGYGLYAGIWGSNVDFDDGDEAHSEFDIYAGVTYDINKWSFAFGGIYYVYPGAVSTLNYDFFEAQASLGYDFDFVALTASINYSPEYFGDSGDAEYYKLAFDAPLPSDFNLFGHFARQDIEDNAAFGTADYYDWSLGLGTVVEGFDVSAQYVDTNISCSAGCGGRGILGVSRAF